MKIIDILFGKRLYIEDPELGKFYSEKLQNPKPPIVWKQHADYPNQEEKVHLFLQGDKREIYPKLKDTYKVWINNYKVEYFPFIVQEVKENKDILSFESLDFVFSNIEAKLKRNDTYLTILGKETDQNFLISIVLKNNKIQTIQIM